MNYEQKYNEALKRAKEIKSKILSSHLSTESCKAVSEYIDEIIPELNESEDERIRKELIDFVNHYRHNTDLTTEQAEWCKMAIAYLEKQKEQKSIEDVVKDITKNKESAIKFLKSAGIVDDNGELAEIYRSEQKPVDKPFEEWIDGWYNEHHRDGYITMDERGFKNFCRGIRNMYQQKPAEWSEEDEKTINDACCFLGEYAGYIGSKNWGKASTLFSIVDKLKSLHPQIKSEWSEEDKKMLDEEHKEYEQWLPDGYCINTFDWLNAHHSIKNIDVKP